MKHNTRNDMILKSFTSITIILRRFLGRHTEEYANYEKENDDK